VTRSIRRAAFVALLSCSLAGVAGAGPVEPFTLVIPPEYENVDGNASVAFPFAITLTSNLPYWFQQVYAAAEFGEPGDVITIQAVRFRVDQNLGTRDPFSVESLELRLGTSSRGPDELESLELGSNIDGGDTTLVFSGQLDWDTCDIPPCTLPAFDLEIAFSEPFVYDPTAGNLIVDFLNLSETYPTQLFDWASSGSDGISSVREVIDRDPPNDFLFVAPTTNGIVTQFVYTVPEAGSALAGAAALVAIGALRRSRA